MSKFHRHPLIGSITLAVLLLVQPANANDAFAVAANLYQSGQWQQAAIVFDRLAQDSQQAEATRLDAQLYAGESLMELGQYAEARQRYQRVQQLGPPADISARAQFRLGEAAWLLGDTETAARLLQTYVDRYPLDASVSYAQTYLTKIGERKSTAENFAVLDEAVGWERDGRHDSALAAYHELLGQLPGGQVRAETLRRAAQLHDRLAQSREALNLYRKYLAEYPSSKQIPQVLLSVAWLHDRLDQPAQAADHFRQVHAKFPQSAQAADAAYWLALANDDEESSRSTHYADWLLAEESLPIERPELWAQALCLKCKLISTAGQWQQIEALFADAEQRLPMGPLKTKLEFWAAEAAFRLRQYDTARTSFTKLEPKTIGIDEAWTAMVPLRRAQLAARRQQWSEVLKILDQLERALSESGLKFELDYEVDYLRGRALAGRGNMTAARKFYGRVLENKMAADTEAAAMAGWMIGETFFHQKDYARARQAYQKVMEQTKLAEWQSRAALQAGKCWELDERWDEAANVYMAARKRWPGSDNEKQLESRIRWAQSQSTQQR